MLNIKFLLETFHRGAVPTTVDGEILAEFAKDPEFVQTQLYSHAGDPIRVRVSLDLPVTYTTTIVDADEMPVRALPEPPRALPSPALPALEFDPGDYGCFYDDEEDWKDG